MTASTTTSATVSPASVTAGSPVTLGATVTADDGTAPTGLIQFVAQFTPEGSSTATPVTLGQKSLTAGTSSSTASLTSSTLQAGRYTVTAQYNPNGSVAWNSSTSSAVSLVVSSVPLAETTLGFTESASSISSDQTVTLSTTLSTAAGHPAPTGIVQFSAGPDLDHTTTVGQASIVNGTATLPKGGWAGGTYVLIANYGGDGVYGAATAGPLSLTVNQVSVAVATTTTITLLPSTINEGQSVTISAHVVKEGTPNPPPGGAIVSFIGGPVGSDPSTWVKIGNPGQAPLDANGNASETVGGWNTGTYTIVAQYSGDITDGISSGSATLSVLKVSNPLSAPTTSLTYMGATSAVWHDSATLSGTLRDSGGNPVAGEPVTFQVGSDPSCTATTDGAGFAACTVTVDSLPGSTTVTATFNGDSPLPGSVASKDFTVDARPTVTMASDVTAPLGGTASLSATLTDTETSAPLAGRTIVLTVGPDSCTVRTDGNGTATCPVTASEGIGSHAIAAAFAGGGGYAGSNGSATLAIQPIATTTTYVGDTQDVTGTTATLSAHVAPEPDGGTVTFTLGTQSCTDAVAGGTATCTLVLAQAPGTGYSVTAVYSGDTNYVTSSTSSPFTIVSPNTTTQAGPVSPVLAGTAATLTATVTPTSAPGTVTFSTGGTTLCSGPLTGGAASCSATFAQTGLFTVTARYSGNGVYPSSSDTTSVLVYAFAPGGGAFVVGDKSATGTVTFWGSQWAKVNVLSGGAAPNEFKGFALNGAATCGVAWSTDPGNSSPPPAGPLPAYMAVIVTAKSTKSGSQISGTAVAVVIVKTNPGYDANPGHAGTGTYFTTLCSA